MSDEIYYHNDEASSSVIVRCIRKFVRGNVLEVGAGIGNITSRLSEAADSVLAIEPSPELFEQLQRATAELKNTEVSRSTTKDLVSAGLRNQFDVVVYFNVLEHIKDDSAELSLARELMTPNSYLVILVPAHQWLYSKIDRMTGHHRRYSKKSITTCVQKEFDIIALWNFDTFGLLPYWIVYKLLGSVSVTGVSAKIYSQVILRLSLFMFYLSGGRAIGKNLIVVAVPKSQIS